MGRFNSFANLPNIPYIIVEYLAKSTLEEAEQLWKLLKYNDYNALSKPNLTFNEKLALIWKNGAQEKYSVFLTNLIEDAITNSKCVFKIYNYMIQPIDVYNSSVVYAFDFLYGGQMSLVDCYGVPTSRADIFVRAICSVLNGTEVGGVGLLALDDSLSRYSGTKSVIGNSKTFTGVCLYLVVQSGNTGAQEGICNG